MAARVGEVYTLPPEGCERGVKLIIRQILIGLSRYLRVTFPHQDHDSLGRKRMSVRRCLVRSLIAVALAVAVAVAVAASAPSQAASSIIARANLDVNGTFNPIDLDPDPIVLGIDGKDN